MFEKSKSIIALVGLGLALSLAGYSGYSMYKKPNDYNITPNVPVNSSKAEIVIDGPKEIMVGQLARFDVSKSAGKTFKWLVLPITKDFEIYSDGRKAVFTSGIPGNYTIIIACATDNDVDVKTFVISVVGTTTPPGPGPGPAPINPGGFVGKVVDMAATVTSANKKSEAMALAGGFDSTIAQIAAGTLTTADQIIESQKEANRTALGNNLSTWVPFLTALQVEMKTQAQSGLLVTSDQHLKMWREISEGLKLVAK